MSELGERLGCIFPCNTSIHWPIFFQPIQKTSYQNISPQISFPPPVTEIVWFKLRTKKHTSIFFIIFIVSSHLPPKLISLTCLLSSLSLSILLSPSIVTLKPTLLFYFHSPQSPSSKSTPLHQTPTARKSDGFAKNSAGYVKNNAGSGKNSAGSASVNRCSARFPSLNFT